jgi:zinc transport system ATP-binding protein
MWTVSMHDDRVSCHTRIRGLSVRSGDTVILDSVDLSFACGEMTAVIGPNGAGKTTLLRAILDEVPHTGEVRFLSPDGETTKPRFGYVPQGVSFDKDSPVSVLDCMAAALGSRPVWLGVKASKRRVIEEALAVVSAEMLLSRRIGELSGGELQRVLLAMAMAPVPNVLLLDEPVSAIDAAGMIRFYETACGLRNRYDLSVIIVSHDIVGIAAHADRMVLLSGKVLAQGTPEKVLSSTPFRSLFGHLYPVSPEAPHVHVRPDGSARPDCSDCGCSSCDSGKVCTDRKGAMR